MTLHIHPVLGLPEIAQGDDLAQLIVDTWDGHLVDHDIVVVTHKVVSKAEGAIRPAVSDADRRRIVEHEAAAILRRRGDLVITQTAHGFICANAGVDRSNTEPGTVVLLPANPDRSAHRLRMRLQATSGAALGVVVTDTFGRPWRRGLTDVAIGVSGLPSLLDLRGTYDTHGNRLDVTEVAVADEIAAAADLVMGKSANVPVAVVRGLTLSGEGRASDLVRGAGEDLFR